MKSIINGISYLALFLLLNSEVVAQPLFSLSPDYFYVTSSSDTLVDLKYWAYGSFEVDSEDTLFVKWKILGQENCPDSWRFIVYDTHNCYMGSWLNSNIDTVNNLVIPMPLGGGYSGKSFNLGVVPNLTPGCCQVKVEFSLVEEPDSIIEVATYDFAMLDSTCFTSADHEIKEEELVFIYPNPANDAFQLVTLTAMTQAAMYDLAGNLVYVTNDGLKNNVEMASLPSGLYILKIGFLNGKTAFLRIVIEH